MCCQTMDNRFWKKMINFFNDPTGWIVIGVLISVLGGIISGLASYQATRKQDRETTAQAQRVNEQQKELIEKSIGIISKQDELKDKQDELNKKSADIIDQQNGLSLKQREMFIISQDQLKEQIAGSGLTEFMVEEKLVDK